MGLYPDFSSIYSKSNKERLLEVKRSIKSIIPLILWFIGSLVAFIYLCLEYPHSSDLGWFSIRWFAVIPAGFLLEIFRKQLDDLYIFSDQRVQRLHGRLSFSYSVPSVKYIDIRSIDVKQSIWGRILNYGNIQIGTAAQAEVELEIEGVSAPLELSSLIEKLRAEAERGMQNSANGV